MASFASSILSSKDHPSLVIGALQLVDLLLVKVPALYKPAFRREGVFHEVEVLAERSITSAKSKDKDKESSEASASESGSVPPVPPVSGASIPGFKKLTSLSLEPEDAITLRARVIQFKHLSNDNNAEEDNAFEALRLLVSRISASNATEKELSEALRELAELFASPHTSVSSFELLQSGVVDGLLQFATDQDRIRKVPSRQYFGISLWCFFTYSQTQKAQRDAARSFRMPSNEVSKQWTNSFRDLGKEIAREPYKNGVVRSHHRGSKQ